MAIGIGDTLQAARLARGEDLVQVAEALKIRRSHVVAMESENFGALGATPYARGHLRNYARYLGLDADRIVAAYDNQFSGEQQPTGIHEVAETTMRSTASPREPLPRWIVVSGVIILLLAVIAFIGTLGDSTPPVAEPPSEQPSPVASAQPSEAATPAPAATAATTAAPSPSPSPTPSPTPSPSPTPEGVELFLAFEADCWISLEVDGAPHPRSETVITAGETIDIEADEEVVARFGNAGGVDVEFNGERLGSPGSSGQVVEVTYTPDGAETST